MEWEDIPSNIGLKSYLIKKDGSVWSKRRHTEIYGNVTNGYTQIALTFDNGDVKHLALHRLLAEIYIPNPDKYHYVTHIDGDKFNNRIDNLKWTNKKNYVNIIQKIAQYENETLIRVWMNPDDPAIVYGIKCSKILRACKSKNGYHSGYTWRFHEKYTITRKRKFRLFNF